ncbi:hypothetical protein FOL47_007453 [Perkinsus chesapeaki]|uniref:Tail specific protease domain-containing protein n=1 Tax=Perkinsus chesapeaki TaxID=330153 RepID=A0A7J6LL37_PERCH|nr:hypothetical protein FOL47_007453 [Perkinsus chesapeaki]
MHIVHLGADIDSIVECPGQFSLPHPDFAWRKHANNHCLPCFSPSLCGTFLQLSQLDKLQVLNNGINLAARQLAKLHIVSTTSQSAIWQHLPNDAVKDYMWGKMDNVNRCLYSLTTTNMKALFTLHNLKYGVTETYAFADVANGLQNSVESNNCGFKLHSLDVDIKSFIDNKIEEYGNVLDKMSADEQKVFLKKSILSAPFHFALQRELSRLNDAHTRYEPPFVDFLYVLPIRFQSSMQGGAQVITLNITELGGSRYPEVYGKPATLHKDGDIIEKVDDKPVLDWMQEMVSDEGPYVGIYQGPLQRLNNVFFVSDLVTRDLRRRPPPTGPLNITFADGSTESVNWLARLSNYTKSAGADAITWRFYNALTNRNPLFQKTVDFEAQFYSKRSSTLWDLAEDTFAEGFDTTALDTILQSSTENKIDDDLLATESVTTTATNTDWIFGTGYQYRLLDDTVVVSVPSFVPSEESSLPAIIYENFSVVQDFARKNNVTRLLFDMSSNGGGYVLSTLALQWYVISNMNDICSPMVRHMTENWQSWVESFGVNFDETIDAFFEENPRLVEDPTFIHGRFQQLYLLMNYAEQLLTDPDTPESQRIETDEVARLKSIEDFILSRRTATSRASTFKLFLTSRSFVNTLTSFGSDILPQFGWYLFDNSELVNRKTRSPFYPPLSQFTKYRSRQWGKTSNYSAEGAWSFCYPLDSTMRSTAGSSYRKDYWTDVAFVTDGNCGSACSLFTETLQLTGRATAFTFGALADQPMDVASFGGGNVYEYDNISPMLNIASHLGYWATFGESDWAKRHTNSWANKPIPFPFSVRARFTWNIGLSGRLGPDALPRQFYIVPPHKHINMWARNLEERSLIHEEIVGYKNWTHLRANPQFEDLGYCPAYRQ